MGEEANKFWKRKPVLDEAGDVVPNSFIAGDARLAEATAFISAQWYREAGDVVFGYNMQPDQPDPISPLTYQALLDVERAHAFVTAVQLAEEEGILPNALPPQEDITIPVIYAPDSGLHTASGVVDGLESLGLSVRLFDDSISWGRIPDTIIEMAEKSGVLLYCDSISCSGNSGARFLSALPKECMGPDGKPITLIAYYNNAHNDMQDDVFSQTQVLFQPAKFQAAAAACDVYFVTNAAEADFSLDPFDRADGMSKVSANNPEFIQYTSQFTKPAEHHVGKFQPSTTMPLPPQDAKEALKIGKEIEGLMAQFSSEDKTSPSINALSSVKALISPSSEGMKR